MKSFKSSTYMLAVTFLLGFAPALVSCNGDGDGESDGGDNGALAEQVCSKMDACNSFNIGTDKNDCVMTATSSIYSESKLNECSACMDNNTCEMISGEGGDVCATACTP